MHRPAHAPHEPQVIADAATGIAYQVFKGYEALTDGNGRNKMRAIEQIAPAAARNFMRAWRYMMDGAKDKAGDPIVGDVPIQDVVKQAIGFTPAEIAEANARNNFRINREQRIKAERSSAMRHARCRQIRER